MINKFFQTVIAFSIFFLSGYTYLEGSFFWNSHVLFTYNGKSVDINSSQIQYDAFVSELRSHGLTVQTFVAQCLAKKRALLEEIFFKKFGITAVDWDSIRAVTALYASQYNSGGNIAGPEKIVSFINNNRVRPLSSLNIEFRDYGNEPRVSQTMSVSIYDNKPSLNWVEVPILYLPSKFNEKPFEEKMGTFLHEIEGHINHNHLVEHIIVSKMILSKCSLPVSIIDHAVEWVKCKLSQLRGVERKSVPDLEKMAEWRKFKRLQEWEADWFSASKSSACALYIEKMNKADYEAYGHCGGKNTLHPDTLKRIDYATIIRRLLETEERLY